MKNVYVLDLNNKKIIKFISINECSTALSIHRETCTNHIKNGRVLKENYVISTNKEELEKFDYSKVKLEGSTKEDIEYLKKQIEYLTKMLQDKNYSSQPSYAVDAEPPKTEVKDEKNVDKINKNNKEVKTGNTTGFDEHIAKLMKKLVQYEGGVELYTKYKNDNSYPNCSESELIEKVINIKKKGIEREKRKNKNRAKDKGYEK